eukprot:2561635-Pyramimonas_sp.AAC.1
MEQGIRAVPRRGAREEYRLGFVVFAVALLLLYANSAERERPSILDADTNADTNADELGRYQLPPKHLDDAPGKNALSEEAAPLQLTQEANSTAITQQEKKKSRQGMPFFFWWLLLRPFGFGYHSPFSTGGAIAGASAGASAGGYAAARAGNLNPAQHVSGSRIISVPAGRTSTIPSHNSARGITSSTMRQRVPRRMGGFGGSM